MKIFFTFSLLFVSAFVFSQGTHPAQPAHNAQPAKQVTTASKKQSARRDTVIESDTSKENKEPRYFYLSLNGNVFVNTRGGFARRFSPSAEFGRTYDIFDIGIATGLLNVLPGASDTAHYVELRPTINIFSKGRFAESLCLGVGYVISGKQGLMSEICNGINFNVSTTFAIAMLQGYMFFDGTNSSRGTQYFGINLTYNLLRKHSVNIERKKKALISDN